MLTLTDAISVIILSKRLSICSIRFSKIETADSIDNDLSPVSVRKRVSSSFNCFMSDLSHLDSSLLVGNNSDLEISIKQKTNGGL